MTPNNQPLREFLELKEKLEDMGFVIEVKELISLRRSSEYLRSLGFEPKNREGGSFAIFRNTEEFIGYANAILDAVNPDANLGLHLKQIAEFPKTS